MAKKLWGMDTDAGTDALSGEEKRRREEEERRRRAQARQVNAAARRAGAAGPAASGNAAQRRNGPSGGETAAPTAAPGPSPAKAAGELFRRTAANQQQAILADMAVRQAQANQVQNAARGAYRAYAQQQQQAVKADTEIRQTQTRQIQSAAQGIYRAYAQQRAAQQNQNGAILAGAAGNPLAAAAGPVTKNPRPADSERRLYADYLQRKQGQQNNAVIAQSRESITKPFTQTNGMETYQTRHSRQEQESRNFKQSFLELMGIGARMSTAGQLSDFERDLLTEQERNSAQQMKDSYAASKELAGAIDWGGRQALIDEYRALRGLVNPYGIVTQNDAQRMNRMMEIRALLENGDIAAGNGLRNYDFRDRAGTVLVGTSEKIGGSVTHAIGEAGRNIGKNLTLAQLGSLDQAMMDQRLGIDHEALLRKAREDVDNEDAKRPWQKVYDFAARLTESAKKDLDQAKEGLNALGRAGVDVAENLIEMGFDRATGSFVGSSLVPMFLRTMGSTAQEARQNGASEDEEFLYGLTKAGIEVATEVLFDGVASIYGAGAADEITERLVRELADTDTGRTLLRTIINAGEEGTEEVISDLLSPLAEAIYRDESLGKLFAELDPADFLHDYFIGATVGMIGSGTNVLSGQDTQANEYLHLVDAAEVEAALHADNYENAGQRQQDIDRAETLRRKILDSPRLSSMMLEGNTDIISLNGYSTIQEYDKMGTLPNGRTIESTKPLYSPALAKWIAHGGEVSVRIEGENVTWTYTSAEGNTASYVNGMIQFGEEYMHPDYKSFNIGAFKDRTTDRAAVKRFLLKEYGIKGVPSGFVVHHDLVNGSIQLIKADIHKQFTHIGGISFYTK